MHDTRQSGHYHIPVCRTNLGKSSLGYFGAWLWNKILSADINPNVSDFIFSRNLKTAIIRHPTGSEHLEAEWKWNSWKWYAQNRNYNVYQSTFSTCNNWPLATRFCWVIVIVSVDSLAPSGARPSIDTVMIKLICMKPEPQSECIWKLKPWQKRYSVGWLILCLWVTLHISGQDIHRPSEDQFHIHGTRTTMIWKKYI